MKHKQTAVQILNTTMHTKLAQCVGKICAYRNVGKEDEAKQWAALLVQELKRNDLI